MEFAPDPRKVPPKGLPVLAPQANTSAVIKQPGLVKLFAQHFVRNGFNAMKAAEAAGFVRPSPTFVRNLADSKPVKEAISELLGPYNDALSHIVTPETVKREIARVAFGDIRGLFNSDGTLKDISDIDDDTAAGISAVEVEVKKARATDDQESERTETRVLKIKRYDKLAALNMLARHTKLIGDDAQDGVNALAGALASRLDAAKRRMTDAQDVESRPLQRVVQSDPPPDEDDHDLY
jgi:phage terminase small subunit